MKNTKLDLCQAAVLGAAIGDAMGVPYEFLGRDEVRDVYCSEMIGNDTDSGISSRWGRLIPAGCWSDDTSMLIASMDAIAKDGGRIDSVHIVDSLIRSQPFLLRAGMNVYAFVADVAVLLISLPICVVLDKPAKRLMK